MPFVVALLLALAALGVAVFLATFDANRYKPDVIDAVRARTGRTLTIDGKLSLALLPRPALAIGAARLSGPDGHSEFARIDSARVAVATWPLLAGRVVADRVTLDGLALEIVRRRDGTTNVDDLLRLAGADPAPRDAPARSIGVQALRLQRASLGWRDEATGAEWRLQQLDVDASGSGNGAAGPVRLSARLIGKRPRVDVVVETAGRLALDRATSAVRLDRLDLKARGTIGGVAGLEARLAGTLGADPSRRRIELAGVELAARAAAGIELRIDAPALVVDPREARGEPLVVGVRLAAPDRRVEATLSLAQPAWSNGRLEFARVKADASLAGARAADAPIAVSSAGHASIDPASLAATLAVTGKFDGTPLHATLSATRLAPLALRYDLQAERIDADRLRLAERPAGGKRPGAADGEPGATARPAPAPTIPAMAGVDTDGRVRVGTLRLAGIEASEVVAHLRSGDGSIELERLGARVFGGTLEVSGALAEGGRHALRAQLDAVDAGMALRALGGRDLLDGRGRLGVDLTARGATLPEIERSLDGSATLALRDGAIKGIDLARMLQRVRQAIAVARGSGGAVEQPGGTGSTAFSSLDASFAVHAGIARNDDLDLRSPLLRVTGAGQVDLPGRSVDYVARAAVIGTPAQIGADLAALRGLTVPVRITGSFDALSYRVDVAGMAAETAR